MGKKARARKRKMYVTEFTTVRGKLLGMFLSGTSPDSVRKRLAKKFPKATITRLELVRES